MFVMGHDSNDGLALVEGGGGGSYDVDDGVSRCYRDDQTIAHMQGEVRQLTAALEESLRDNDNLQTQIEVLQDRLEEIPRVPMSIGEGIGIASFAFLIAFLVWRLL